MNLVQYFMLWSYIFVTTLTVAKCDLKKIKDPVFCASKKITSDNLALILRWEWWKELGTISKVVSHFCYI